MVLLETTEAVSTLERLIEFSPDEEGTTPLVTGLLPGSFVVLFILPQKAAEVSAGFATFGGSSGETIGFATFGISSSGFSNFLTSASDFAFLDVFTEGLESILSRLFSFSLRAPRLLLLRASYRFGSAPRKLFRFRSSSSRNFLPPFPRRFGC